MIDPINRLIIFVLLIISLTLSLTRAGFAESKLDARYSISMAGITIGKSIWSVEVGDTQYSMTASARTSGVVRAIASGEASGAAQGLLNPEAVIPTAFTARLASEDENDAVRMTLSSGNVKDLIADPPQLSGGNRIPLVTTHRQGIIDPMSAGLMLAEKGADLLTPRTCQQTLPIFDGRRRYDVALSFKRMEKVKAEVGYEGAALVCAVSLHPIAGHRAGGSALEYLVKTKNMEIWL
ncbi:MAG TPA: DUF3108 domain-containing protein, partial [Xanthobacteraceae bacterium]|nr:DUF3108 domain-containing protein [Xanthobacteraceae bacterium]